MQQVQKITQILQTKQIESASRERVEGMKLQSAEVRAQASLEQERLKAQASILTHAGDKAFDAAHDHALSKRAHLQDLAAASQNTANTMLVNAHQQAITPPAPAPAERGE